MMHILGLCGSLRKGSYNRRLLTAAANLLPDGATVEVFERLVDIPPYSEEIDGGSLRAELPTPVVVQELRDAISAADAVLIVTPEYNASVPGQLKNVLDWASSPFPNNVLRHKPTAVLGASTGEFGAVWAQAELRKILRAIGSQVLDVELPVPQVHEIFTDDGRLTDPRVHSALGEVVRQLVSAACTEGLERCA